VQHERGLLDLAKDPTLAIASLVMPTDVPGLVFLPAGRPDEKSTELLASGRMRQLVAQLASQDPARLVLFDSAPLLLTTESQALAQVAGQILVVVRADLTPQQVVLEGIETITEEKPVSLVLNQTVRQPHGYYYQYGGAYQYGGSATPRDKAGDA
jgi:protein-tyrosine kinase